MKSHVSQLKCEFSDYVSFLAIQNSLMNCDIWDTDYKSVTWEPEFMTIFVTWKLIVTLDSIRNSCNIWCEVTTLEALEKCFGYKV